jgi:hypothetical protein
MMPRLTRRISNFFEIRTSVDSLTALAECTLSELTADLPYPAVSPPVWKIALL